MKKPIRLCATHHTRLAANGHCWACEEERKDREANERARLERENFRATAPAEMRIVETSTGRVTRFSTPKVRRPRR